MLLTPWSARAAWLLVPVLSVVVAVIGAFAHASVDTRFPTTAGVRPRRGTLLPVAIAIVVVVLGLGGWAVTTGVRYAVSYVSGNQTGPDRLVAPEKIEKGHLVLQVDAIEQTRDFTRVQLTAINNAGNALGLVPSYAQLRGTDGTTLPADSFRSRWAETVGDGAKQTGWIVFSAHLPADVDGASFGFTVVFPDGFNGPRSITVTGLSLKKPPG